jgi:TMEM199 family protein
LMARLRREEEERAYERILHPERRLAQSTRLIAGPADGREEDLEQITYADASRQIALIVNILLSIVACGVAIWMAASHWSTPKRLGLSMGGGGFIGIAEVVVYAGYLRRVRDAKANEKKRVEVKEIIETWVIGGDSKGDEITAIRPKDEGNPTRRRRPG